MTDPYKQINGAYFQTGDNGLLSAVTDQNTLRQLQSGVLSATGQDTSALSALTPSSLAPTTAITPVQPNTPPVPPVSGLDSSVTPTTSATSTPYDKGIQDLIDSITGENNTLTGESAYRSSLETASGISDLTKTQNDLSARLKALQNEALAIPQQLQQGAEGRGITSGGLAPLQTGALRNNAIQALGVSALLEASRGNLTFAQDQVDRAVAAKFDPIKADHDAKIANLDLILKSPGYTRAEKARADAQLAIQQAAKTKTELDASNLAEAQKKVLEYTNIANASQLKEMQAAKTPLEVAAIANKYGLKTLAERKAELDNQKLQQDLLNAGGGAGAKYVPGANPTVDAWISNISNGTGGATISNVPKNLQGLVNQGLMAQKGTPSEILQATADSLKTLNDMVANDHGFTGAVGSKLALGTIGGLVPSGLPGSDEADFLAQLNKVKNEVILPNLKLLKGMGRVTDREFKSLSDAITALGPQLSEGKFKEELATLTKSISDKLAGLASESVNVGSGQKVTVQGQEFVVGQQYQDAKGNKGSFDATGKWIPAQ